MPKAKALPKVECANALSLSDFTSSFLPSLSSSSNSTIAFSPSNPPDASQTPKSFGVSLEFSSTISPADFDACFSLIEASSAADYAGSSTGWKPRSKRKEMQLPDMRYLLVRSTQQDAATPPAAPVEAFASFMLTYEDGYEVAYLYEVHLVAHLRGMGLGRRLMELVQEAGRRAGMAKTMLTVYAVNAGARRFYERLGFGVDAYSPQPRVLRGGVVREPDYLILSKAL